MKKERSAKSDVDSEHPAHPAVTRDVPDVFLGISGPDNANSVLFTKPNDAMNDSNITKSDHADNVSHPDPNVENEVEEGVLSTDERIGQECAYPSPFRPSFNY